MWMHKILILSGSICAAALFLSIEARISHAGFDTGIQQATQTGTVGRSAGHGGKFGGGSASASAAEFNGGMHRQPVGHRQGNFHGRHFAHFTPELHNAWQHGHWDHGDHNGSTGWWWVTHGLWYYYPKPIYPYPDYISDNLYPPPPAIGRQYWYFCSSPLGYYPYVLSCSVPWQNVAGSR